MKGMKKVLSMMFLGLLLAVLVPMYGYAATAKFDDNFNLTVSDLTSGENQVSVEFSKDGENIYSSGKGSGTTFKLSPYVKQNGPGTYKAMVKTYAKNSGTQIGEVTAVKTANAEFFLVFKDQKPYPSATGVTKAQVNEVITFSFDNEDLASTLTEQGYSVKKEYVLTPPGDSVKTGTKTDDGALSRGYRPVMNGTGTFKETLHLMKGGVSLGSKTATVNFEVFTEAPNSTTEYTKELYFTLGKNVTYSLDKASLEAQLSEAVIVSENLPSKMTAGISKKGLSLSGSASEAGEYQIVVKFVQKNNAVELYTINIVVASAEGAIETVNENQYDYFNYSLNVNNSGKTVHKIEKIGGELPEGTKLEIVDSKARLRGTSETAGEYRATYKITLAGNEEVCVELVINVKAPDRSFYSEVELGWGETYNYYLDKVGGINGIDPVNDENVTNFDLCYDRTPKGFSATQPMVGWRISGTAQETGEGEARFIIEFKDGTVWNEVIKIIVISDDEFNIKPNEKLEVGLAHDVFQRGYEVVSAELYSGTLPPGVSIATIPGMSAILTGTPTENGVYEFVVKIVYKGEEGKDNKELLHNVKVTVNDGTLVMDEFEVKFPLFTESSYALYQDLFREGKYVVNAKVVEGTLPEGIKLQGYGFENGGFGATQFYGKVKKAGTYEVKVESEFEDGTILLAKVIFVIGEGQQSVMEVFTDVYDDWYTAYVQYVYDNSLMTGIKGTTLFQPNANITKAQVAQVLYNMEEQPAVSDKKVFTELKDVYSYEWYANAVAWAYNTGVVTGDLNSKKFNPNANVTREQLALMMYRYAGYKKYDTSASSNFSGLVGADKIADWSMAGVKWAVGAGMISGVEKNGVKDIAPQGNASRAQVAAILQRFCENVK